MMENLRKVTCIRRHVGNVYPLLVGRPTVEPRRSAAFEKFGDPMRRSPQPLASGLENSCIPLQVLITVVVQGVVSIWLNANVRRTFAISGLILAAILAYWAIEDFSYALPSIAVYAAMKLAVHVIPWRS